MSDQVQLIKERLNIVDVIGQYVKLTKAGKNYKGLSPFNKEKTPSFFVSPDKGMYYDFSSGQGGDMFSFVERMEGLDFKGALELLAERAGVELTRESPDAKDKREQLFSILEEVTRYYQTKLSENADARAYLKKRGVEETTMRNFRLGFAEDSWQALHDHLLSQHYTEEDMERAGLIKKGDKGSYYDRFRSRIMFPIMDNTGRVVAFSGRIFGEPARDENNAKYLNSPETQLFDKSRILYGFHRAKQFIRKYDFTILVEGQMDLVLSHQIGYGNTVAVSGTGLTEHHLVLIDKLSKKLVLAFDADRAGVASAGRGAFIALKRGIDVKVALVPEGKDPADCILEDPAEWKRAIKNSKHVVDFFMDKLITESKQSGWDARKCVNEARESVLPYIAVIQSATERAHFSQRVASALAIHEDAVREDVHALRTHTTQTHTQPQQTPHAVQQPKNTFSRKTDLEKTLLGFIFMHETSNHDVLIMDEVQKTADAFGIPLNDLRIRYEGEKEQFIEESNKKYPASHEPMEIAMSLLKDLGRIYVTDNLDMVRLLQIEAEREGDETQSLALGKKVADLSKHREALE